MKKLSRPFMKELQQPEKLGKNHLMGYVTQSETNIARIIIMFPILINDKGTKNS